MKITKIKSETLFLFYYIYKPFINKTTFLLNFFKCKRKNCTSINMKKLL